MRLLSETKTGLPSSWYFDAEQYQRELAAVWYTDWVCIGRVEMLQRPGDFFVASIGTQSIIIARTKDDSFRAFHNTCPHRGAVLCQSEQGRFRNGRIICPYHTWTYSTDGQLLDTPGRIASDDFDATNYSLYSVHVDTWGGFIFVNLAKSPELALVPFLGSEADILKNWPLAEMHSVHQEKFSLACNWKIFWRITTSAITVLGSIRSCARSCRYTKNRYSTTWMSRAGSPRLTVIRISFSCCGSKDLDLKWPEFPAQYRRAHAGRYRPRRKVHVSNREHVRSRASRLCS